MLEYALSDVSILPDPREDASALSDIPAWRRDYILRFTRAEDRGRSLGAWLLMARMLEQRGFCARDVAVDARGKPYLNGVFFSLSHSGDLALCAVSDAPVGCDIERLAEPPMEIAPRVFLPSERAFLQGARDGEDARRRFFALWTLKESYMKMTGEGLSLAPERIEIRMPGPALLRDGAPQPCALFCEARGGYMVAVCAEGEGKGEKFVYRGMCGLRPA